jgi:hypothetical protein
MEPLSQVESAIIRSLVIRQYGADSPFLAQLSEVVSTVRQVTGKGYYLDLILSDTITPVDKANGDASDGYPTLLDKPRDMVGFTLFIRDGVLSWLEGYTFGGDSWPAEPMEKWLVLEDYEPAEAPPAAGVASAVGPRRERRLDKGETIRQLIRDNPGGLSHDEILERMQLKGDRPGENSVSNTLVALTKSSQVVHKDGKYRAA